MQIVILKLGLAAAAGLILGIERESKHKPLGLKTCVVISVASCLLTIVSIEAAISTYNGTVFIRADPMRLSAQIVSGVGFLGAGVILRRSNDVISGLTTAAIVWAASGLGIAIGAGYYIEVAIGIAIIVASVRLLPFIVRKIGPSALREQEVKLNIFVHKDANMETIVEAIQSLFDHIRDLRIIGKADGHKVELRCTVEEGTANLFTYYAKLYEIEGVERAELEGR